MKANEIINSDVIDALKGLPDNSIDCCVTSPPYFGLRDYGVEGQIGLEKTPEEYIAKLTEVFRHVRRVLKPEGTLWLNIGDSYAGSGKGAANYPENASKYKQGTNRGSVSSAKIAGNTDIPGYKPKDLIGIPWMLAFALRSDGWYLRQDIIWYKPNAMPESVKDRCTKSHEYIFLLSKSTRYFFNNDAIKNPAKKQEKVTYNYQVGGKKRIALNQRDPALRKNTNRCYTPSTMVNKRDVWSVNTKPFKKAHFAVFPEQLVEPCIKAGCPKDGIVLDTFMGSGTTAIVAKKLGRKFIGIELNSTYVELANERLKQELGLFF